MPMGLSMTSRPSMAGQSEHCERELAYCTEGTSQGERRRSRHGRCVGRWPGLCTSAAFQLDGFVDLLHEHLLERLNRPDDRAAGGVLVPATTELLGDGADVDVALRSHAHA